MLAGLNSNIKHEGKIFHIQTEDSGKKYAHVISHLFLDGGILASVKTDYSHLSGKEAAELEEELNKIMRKSHRTMVRSLTSGSYNSLVGLGPDEGAKEPSKEAKAASKKTAPSSAKSKAAGSKKAASGKPDKTTWFPEPEEIATLLEKLSSPARKIGSVKEIIYGLLGGAPK